MKRVSERRAPAGSASPVRGEDQAVVLILVLKDRLFSESIAGALAVAGTVRCLIDPLDREGEPGQDPPGAVGKAVVLLELTPGAAETELLLHRVKARFPEGRILLLSDGSSPAAEVEVLVRGVQGIFSRSAGLESLTKAIAAVAAGEIWADREVTGRAIHRFTSATPGREREKERKKLTPREAQILALVAGGLKNRQIADKLFISEQTVKVHLNSVFRKIGAGDRLQAALYAIHHGIVPQKFSPGAAS